MASPHRTRVRRDGDGDVPPRPEVDPPIQKAADNGLSGACDQVRCRARSASPGAEAPDSRTAARNGWPSPRFRRRMSSGPSPCSLPEDGAGGGDEIGQGHGRSRLAVAEAGDGSPGGVDRPRLQRGHRAGDLIVPMDRPRP